MYGGNEGQAHSQGMEVNSNNIESLLHKAVSFNAVKCFKVLINYQDKNKKSVLLNAVKLFAALIIQDDGRTGPRANGDGAGYKLGGEIL